MKRKYPYYLILLILISSSCNTFNNGNLFSGRQGENKVIDRDFEAQDDFEETNQVTETEAVQEPIESVAQEDIAKIFVEKFTSETANNEEKLDEPFEVVDDNKTLDTNSDVNENVVSEDFVETKQERPARKRNEFMAVVLILILVAFALVFVIGLFALLGW
jgi:hypothetical protein